MVMRSIVAPIVRPIVRSIVGSIIQPAANDVFSSASLYIDFLSGKLDPRITFSRASNATRVNSSGIIETVLTNLPRFDYDPVSRNPKGLLIEEQRTNLLLYSEQFDNAAWSKTASVITPDFGISPSGLLTSEKLTNNSDNTNHNVFQSASFTAGATTFSIYAKYIDHRWIGVRIGVGADQKFGSWDLQNGVVGSVSAGATIDIKNAGNGWFRLTLTATLTVSGNANLIVGMNDTDTTSLAIYSGTGTSLLIWGTQLEQGIFPTSYITTTTSSVTRAADIASIIGSNFTSWFRADEGTIFTESSIPYTLLNNRGPIRFDDTTDNNRIMIRNGGASSRLDGRVVTAGSSVANLETASTAISPNVVFKAALIYKTNDFAMSVNGLSVATDNLGAVPIVSRLILGDSEMTTAIKGSTIKRIAFFPRRMTNSELQGISTP